MPTTMAKARYCSCHDGAPLPLCASVQHEVNHHSSQQSSVLRGRVIPSHQAYALMAPVCCGSFGFCSFSPGALAELVNGSLGRV